MFAGIVINGGKHNMKLFALLYADDTVILDSSKDYLQKDGCI